MILSRLGHICGRAVFCFYKHLLEYTPFFMDTWVTKILLPLLIVALAAAVYFEFGSVETFDLQSGRYESGSSTPQAVQQSRRVKSQSQGVASKRESRLAAGEHYASLKELVSDQQAAGYVRTGYFGKFWPATVAEITSDQNGISFVRQNGTRHNYTKFDGYDMKMVRLRAGAKETIVVFRSQSRR
jgi:hypothetical protein